MEVFMEDNSKEKKSIINKVNVDKLLSGDLREVERQREKEREKVKEREREEDRVISDIERKKTLGLLVFLDKYVGMVDGGNLNGNKIKLFLAMLGLTIFCFLLSSLSGFIFGTASQNLQEIRAANAKIQMFSIIFFASGIVIGVIAVMILKKSDYKDK